MKILGKTKIEKDFLEISFSQLLSITGGVIAGTFLVSLIDNFGLISGLFILFPGLLELHGNIYGSLSARLGNLLLLNELKDKKDLKHFLKHNIPAVLFLVFFVSLVLGLVSYAFVYFIFDISNQAIVLISVLSSLLSSFFEIPLTIGTTLWVYRKGLDPEDIMGPYVTTLGDIISIISITIIAGLVI